MKHIFFVFLCGCLFFGRQVCACAALTNSMPLSSEQTLIQSFLDEGASHFRNQNTTQAIRSFARVLLLDPYDVSARDYLNRILRERRLTGFYQIELIKLNGLLDQISNLTQKLFYYRDKIVLVTDTLANYQFDHEALIRILDETHGLLQGYSASSLSFSKGSEDPLIALNEILDVQRKKLIDHLRILESQYAKLQNFQNTNTPAAVRSRKEIQRLSENQTVPLVNRTVAGSDRNIENENENGTDSVARDHSQEEFVSLTLQLSEKERQIEQSTKNFTKVSTALEELDARFVLSQQLLSQKQEEIDRLRAELHDTKQELVLKVESLNEMLAKREQQLIEAMGMLSIYKAEFQDAFVSSKKFDDQKREIQTLHAFNGKLMNQVSQVQSNYLQMEGVIGIYQNKLKEANQTLKVRQADVSTLEERIDFVHKQLYEREKIIKRAQEDFRFLQEKIRKIETEIHGLKKDIKKEPREAKTYIRDLQAQVRNLGQFVGDQVKSLKVNPKILPEN